MKNEPPALSTEELIHLFSSRTWAISFQPLSPEMEDLLRKWRDYPKDVEVPIVAFCPDGMLFGQRTGNVTLVKTIVSPSMLYPDQLPLYAIWHLRQPCRCADGQLRIPSGYVP